MHIEVNCGRLFVFLSNNDPWAERIELVQGMVLFNLSSGGHRTPDECEKRLVRQMNALKVVRQFIKEMPDGLEKVPNMKGEAIFKEDGDFSIVWKDSKHRDASDEEPF